MYYFAKKQNLSSTKQWHNWRDDHKIKKYLL